MEKKSLISEYLHALPTHYEFEQVEQRVFELLVNGFWEHRNITPINNVLDVLRQHDKKRAEKLRNAIYQVVPCQLVNDGLIKYHRNRLEKLSGVWQQRLLEHKWIMIPMYEIPVFVKSQIAPVPKHIRNVQTNPVFLEDKPWFDDTEVTTSIRAWSGGLPSLGKKR